MAAVTGSSIITAAGSQISHKPSDDPSVQIDTANSQSDVEGSADTDAQSESSVSIGSDSDPNAAGSLANIDSAASKVVPAPGKQLASNQFATSEPSVSQVTPTARDASHIPSNSPDGAVRGTQSLAADRLTTESRTPPTQRSTGTLGSSHRPLRAMPPPSSQYERLIAPNGPALESFQGKDVTAGYRPKLLQPEDGRVTATIPHKLRGNLDANSGNFATIHMDLPTTTRQERMSAAQRSSEATVAAAEKANQASLAAQRSSEATVAAAERVSRAGYSRPKRQSGPSDGTISSHSQHYPPPAYYGLPTRMPLPQETKAEQARLLTLLRAIHPNSIVEQLCKGLAYFGGIPGAPPPLSGVFPMSEGHNGSGALFVNWLSEIFPPVYTAPTGAAPGQSAFATHAARAISASQISEAMATEKSSTEIAPSHVLHGRPDTGPQIDTVILPKRKRGRPKGSKSSKPRKDKGIKKGPNPNRAPSSNNNPTSAGQEPEDSEAIVARPPASSELPSTDSQDRENVSPSQTASGKRRGRPPGSKNRPKALLLGDQSSHAAQAAQVMHDPENTYHRHILPDIVSPTASRSSTHTIAPRQRQLETHQTQAQVQQPPGVLPTITFPSPPVRAAVPAIALDGKEPRKRKLSDSLSNPASYDNSSQAARQQVPAPEAANSQGIADLGQPQKRRRASNGIGTQVRPENLQTRSPATSASVLSPTVNLGDVVGSANSTTPGSSFEGGAHASRTPVAMQPGGPHQRSPQTFALSQQQVRQGQNVSPGPVQSNQGPAQQPVGSQKQQASAQLPARQPNIHSSSQQQQRRPSQVLQNWQRTMVGPQQAANPDAQPVAQHARYGAQSSEQQQRR